MTDKRHWERNDGKPGSYQRVPFALERSCLIIIDMQRYWTDTSSPFGMSLKAGFPDTFSYFYDRLAHTVRPNLIWLLELYRSRGLPVAHVTTGAARDGGMDLLFHMQRRFAHGGRTAGNFDALQVGSEWHQVTPDLAPGRGELVLNKSTRSAFNSTGIDQLLRHMRVEQLVIGGLASNACVQATAVDGADRGYETFLVEDCCVTFGNEAHAPVFDNFHWIFGTVVLAEDIVRAARAS